MILGILSKTINTEYSRIINQIKKSKSNIFASMSKLIKINNLIATQELLVVVQAATAVKCELEIVSVILMVRIKYLLIMKKLKNTSQ